jgi:hypothetical protein
LYPDTIIFPPVLSAAAQAFVDENNTAASLTNIEFEFTNGPEPNYQNVQDWVNNPSAEETLPNFDTEGEPFDFGYDNPTLAVASITGGPLGDLNWDIVEPPAPEMRVVKVAPGFGTLNEAVFSDTTANGDRVNINTVYELERDGIYLLNGTMEHRFPLTIVAEPGNGAKPVLQPAVQTGGESSRAFVPRDDLTLRNLYVTNEDEQDGLNKNMIRIKGDKVRIIIDSCFLEKDTQAPFRLDGDSVNLYLSNSVFANFASDFNNGRVIDDRGNNIDTLIATNCTFYNIGSRILRDNGGLMTYGEFDHCTFANTGRRVVEFGEAVTAKFTNNLIHNAGIIGQDDESDNAHIMVDSLENQTALDLGLTQEVTISNVNYYVDPGYTDLYPDTIIFPPVLSAAAQAYVDENGTGATLTNVEFEFTNGPEPNYQNVQDWVNNPSAEETLPDFDTEGEPFDFGYDNATLATASTTDGPLGDLNWEITGSVGIFDNAIAGANDKIKVYPNPVNEFARFDYTVENKGFVSIEIYDIVGKKVTSLVNEEKPVGDYTIDWNVTSQTGTPVSSGIYFLKMNVNGQSYTQKMIIK